MGVSPLWLIIVALITWSLGASYYPGQVHGITPAASYALGLGSALLLFASILAHEAGHALVARRRGVEIEEIDLWLLGGVARMSRRPKSAGDELSFALAGPAVTAVIAAIFGAATLALPASARRRCEQWSATRPRSTLLILGFNLVPAFPLDGGRVARALLWRRSGRHRRRHQHRRQPRTGVRILPDRLRRPADVPRRARRTVARAYRRVPRRRGERRTTSGAGREHVHRRSRGRADVRARDQHALRIDPRTGTAVLRALPVHSLPGHRRGRPSHASASSSGDLAARDSSPSWPIETRRC